MLVEERDVLLEVQAEQDGLQFRVAPHLPLPRPLLQQGCGSALIYSGSGSSIFIIADLDLVLDPGF